MYASDSQGLSAGVTGSIDIYFQKCVVNINVTNIVRLNMCFGLIRIHFSSSFVKRTLYLTSVVIS